MVRMSRSIPLLGMATYSLAWTWCASGGAEILLKFPQYENVSFPNFSSISVPSADVQVLEIILQNAIAEIQLASARATLNQHPVSVFMTVNPMLRGVRVILRLGQTLNPHYRLRSEAENILTFEALDQLRNRYRGQFFLTVTPDVPEPALRPSSHPIPERTVEPPPAYRAPEIKWGGGLAAEAASDLFHVDAEILDEHGLRRVVIEVNGKDIETIVLENNVPVRKRGTFRTAKALPGTVEGSGRHLIIRVPVKIGKKLNALALRAENVMGLLASETRTVTKVKR